MDRLRYRGCSSWFALPHATSNVEQRGMSAMSPATSAQVRRRQAARKQALERQQKLNEERRRRDEQELELAAEFAVLMEECEAARSAVQAAEASMGRVVDSMIGELRIRYQRAARLLLSSEDELKRLRLVATDVTSRPTDDAAKAAARDAARPERSRESSRNDDHAIRNGNPCGGPSQ
jgi:hypothetical protein